MSDDKIQNSVGRKHIFLKVREYWILESYRHIANISPWLRSLLASLPLSLIRGVNIMIFFLQDFTEKLMNGDVQSERKTWFFFGSQEQLNKLKHMSGFGPVASDSQVFFLNNFTN